MNKDFFTKNSLDERFALFKKLGQARTAAGILPDMPNPISALPGFGGLSAGIQGEEIQCAEPPRRQRGPPEAEESQSPARKPLPDNTPQLYQMPDLATPLSMFDSDDLCDDAVFILHSPPSTFSL